ncbi:CRISPR-associated protein Csx19 [Marinactinospora rubrisoli]|uniref:CRISPR-associated protein Csx19 n=1 Tax=Marinactinospora rubrisoli TaxID=2715399 RepID=A0ABW2KKV4_9ACTN
MTTNDTLGSPGVAPEDGELPAPHGVLVRELGDDEIAAAFADVFGEQRRCRVLDAVAPGERQWLLAEFGHGRITGGCPHEAWRLSSTEEATQQFSAPTPAADRSDAWQLLEAVVFSPSAELRIGEGAERAWLSRDADDVDRLPPWLQPWDRSFLLLGGTVTQIPASRPDVGPLCIAEDRSGSTAVHPVEWRNPAPGGKKGYGSWLTVREYWAEDPATGAVGVVFHRLVGYTCDSEPLPGTSPTSTEERA